MAYNSVASRPGYYCSYTVIDWSTWHRRQDSLCNARNVTCPTMWTSYVGTVYYIGFLLFSCVASLILFYYFLSILGVVLKAKVVLLVIFHYHGF